MQLPRAVRARARVLCALILPRVDTFHMPGEACNLFSILRVFGSTQFPLAFQFNEIIF